MFGVKCVGWTRGSSGRTYGSICYRGKSNSVREWSLGTNLSRADPSLSAPNYTQFPSGMNYTQQEKRLSTFHLLTITHGYHVITDYWQEDFDSFLLESYKAIISHSMSHRMKAI